MELYGRPHVARRNTLPNVSFLNDAKAWASTTAFAAPTTSRNEEKDPEELQVTGGRAGAALPGAESGNNAPSTSTPAASTAPMLFTHLSRSPPLAGRPPLERPQSGGIRRPAPGAPPPSATMAKQRPSTARESSRAVSRPSAAPSLSSDLEPLFTRRHSESTPEVGTADCNMEKDPSGASGENNAPLDEAYIRQLKADIVYCHQAMTQHQVNSLGSSSVASRSHTHVKNVQSMRESRGPQHTAAASSDVALYAQLARYSYSPDPAQLRSAKARLEDMLAQSLTQLMRQCLHLRDNSLDSADQSVIDEERQQQEVDSIGLERPTGIHLPFGNGCGSDSASIYTGCLVGVLRRVEKFRSMIVGLNSEKMCLVKDMQEKDRCVKRLSEQLDLFKDALAKAMAKNSGCGSGAQSRRRMFAPSAEDTTNLFIESSRGPEHDAEKELEHSAQINSLERERTRLEETIRTMQAEQDSLTAQLKATRSEVDQQERAAIAAREELEQERLKSAQDAQRRARQEQELRDALKSAAERYRQLDDLSSREKQTLRGHKQDLEVRIRNLEEELRAKMGLLGQNTSTMTELKRSKERVESLTSLLKTTEGRLAVTQRQADTLRKECEKASDCIQQLRQELSGSASRIEDLTTRVDQSNAARASQESVLRETVLKLSQAKADADRQTAIIQHQANQVALLEAKLSKSVSLDEEEYKQRQKNEETEWHQKLAALEHALAVEKQTIQSLKEQYTTSVDMEKEKASHSVSQAKAISQELETANLCLAERKKQREKELQEFADQKSHLLDRIARLIGESDAAKASVVQLQQQLARSSFENPPSTKISDLESKIHELEDQLASALDSHSRLQSESSVQVGQLRVEYESKQRYLEESHRQLLEDEIESYKSAAENALTAELAVRQQLDVVTAERDVLLHRLKDGRETPRGSALSEARVELQRAKLKIAALEEKLNKTDSARSKNSEGNAALLAAREKNLIEDQKSLKKSKQEVSAERKQLRTERESLDSERAQAEADRLRNRDDHRLLRQIIALLSSRLALQMQLLDIIPPEVAAARQDQRATTTHQRHKPAEPSQSLVEFVSRFRLEHGGEWREMQVKWERLQQELDDVDWQLVHMRNRLEELNVSASSTSSAALSRPKTPTTSPFSDAVAAGKDTVPVAEQLASATKAASTASPSAFVSPVQLKLDCNSDDRPISAGTSRSRDEDHETFAAALAKEMRAMKESYETKLDDLQQELRTAQRLRMESAQRLRAELDDEKRRSHQIIAQLTDRCAALEAQLQALQRAFALAQDAQIELLYQHRSATTDAARAQILRSLHGAVAEACREEMARREARELERVRKLQDYCGSSSVTVEREDKKRLL